MRIEPCPPEITQGAKNGYHSNPSVSEEARHAAQAEPVPVGWEVLDRVGAFMARFVAFPSDEALTAVTLWVAHTHAIDLFDNTPRLALLSPEPGSGKSRALEIIQELVARPLATMNCSPAYLIRRVGQGELPPTILYDEIDTVFGPRAKGNEDIRGLINAGHHRGATAGRCVTRGNAIDTEDFPAFAPVALAGLGELPDTIMTRSVVIRMRRRGPGEAIEPYRPRLHRSLATALREELAQWVGSVRDQIDGVFPDLPAGVVDRPADVWEPMVAIADAAGGDWPTRARVSCVSLVSSDEDQTVYSTALRLLEDLRTIFREREAMFTSTILSLLNDIDEESEVAESGWYEYHGHGLNPSTLAELLGKFRIKPRQVRIGNQTKKGYRRFDLDDAWQRYLPAPRAAGETSETTEPCVEAEDRKSEELKRRLAQQLADLR